MTEVPFFSVVIPTYNRAQLVRRAVVSVLGQQWSDLELIVVDDASDDDTIAVLSREEDPRLRVEASEERLGVTGARNRGASQARGRVLLFLDSDDEALPGWLSVFEEAFREPSVWAASAGAQIVTMRGDRVVGTLDRRPVPRGPFLCDQTVLYVPPGTFAIRREVFERVGGYWDVLRYAENSELFFRVVPTIVAAGGKIVASQRLVMRQYRQQGAWEGSPQRYRWRMEAAENVLERHGERMLAEQKSMYVNYSSVAGMNALRVGEAARARRHFRSALRAAPGAWKSYARYLRAFLPFRGGAGHEGQEVT